MCVVDELLSKLLRPARVLCVETDRTQAGVFQEQVQQRYECAVDWAASGAEAKDWLDRARYDLFLLAPFLPDMTTAEILRYAKQKAPAMPVVVLTSYPGGKLPVEEAVVCGVLGAVACPVRLEDVEDLFRVFKIRVRSCEDARWLASRGLAAVAV